MSRLVARGEGKDRGGGLGGGMMVEGTYGVGEDEDVVVVLFLWLWRV